MQGGQSLESGLTLRLCFWDTTRGSSQDSPLGLGWQHERTIFSWGLKVKGQKFPDSEANMPLLQGLSNAQWFQSSHDLTGGARYDVLCEM